MNHGYKVWSSLLQQKFALISTITSLKTKLIVCVTKEKRNARLNLLADDNENDMNMLINCWILDHVFSFLQKKLNLRKKSCKFVTKTKISRPVVGVAVTHKFMDLCTPFVSQGEFHCMYSKSPNTAFKICSCGFQLYFPIYHGHALLLSEVAHCKHPTGFPEMYLSNAVVLPSC